MNVREEQRKLTAAWLNSIASGSIVTGLVTPTIAVTLHLSGAELGRPLAFLSLAWLAIGCALMSLRGAFSEVPTMSVLEVYTYFVLPLLVLGIGFGAFWLTRSHDHAR